MLERALRAGVRVPIVLADREAQTERLSIALGQAKEAGSTILEAPGSVLEEFSEGRSADGVVALVETRSFSADELFALGSPGERLVLVAVDTKEPGNLGALCRTALAAGATGMLVGGEGTDIWHPKALRTSRGSVFKLPLASLPGVEEAVGVAQAAGFVAVGAVVSGGQRVGALGRHRRDRALYLGGEAHGLSDSVSETLDELVSIPMREGVDSYAVNPAAAILLHGLGPFGDRS